MPPHIESTQATNEWNYNRSKSTGDIKGSEFSALCGCLDSPLFRDEDEIPHKPLSRLDRRQSNPDLLAAESQGLVTVEKGINNPPLSKIESIIGPESRYYNNEPQPTALRPAPQAQAPAVAAPPRRATAPAPAVAQKTPKTPAVVAPPNQKPQQPPQAQVQPKPSVATTNTGSTPAPTDSNKPKPNPRKPLMRRVSHTVSKKGRKLVRYIGGKKGSKSSSNSTAESATDASGVSSGGTISIEDEA